MVKEICHCEDPDNAGQLLKLCGQAICWRLQGLIPVPSVVHEDEDVILKFVEDEKEE